MFCGNTLEITKEVTEFGQEKIKIWLDSFKLNMNMKETNYIALPIKSVNRPTFNHFELKSTHVKEVCFTRYLGLLLKNISKHYQKKLTTNIYKLIYRSYILRNIVSSR